MYSSDLFDLGGSVHYALFHLMPLNIREQYLFVFISASLPGFGLHACKLISFQKAG